MSRKRFDEARRRVLGPLITRAENLEVHAWDPSINQLTMACETASGFRRPQAVTPLKHMRRRCEQQSSKSVH
jgi:hypothetical protein